MGASKYITWHSHLGCPLSIEKNFVMKGVRKKLVIEQIILK